MIHKILPFRYVKTPEEFLTLNLTRYERSIISQFRYGILPLEIEVGRYRDIPLSDRLCHICSSAVEDEIHFLCDCPAYSHVREIIFAQARDIEPTFQIMDNIDKFVFLMSNLQKPVAYYLIEALAIRTSLLTITKMS